MILYENHLTVDGRHFRKIMAPIWKKHFETLEKILGTQSIRGEKWLFNWHDFAFQTLRLCFPRGLLRTTAKITTTV